jgi:hypothetical protein
MKKRKISFVLSIISGIFLILSGTNGVSFFKRLSEIILRYFDIIILKIIFILLTIIASLGGIAVILGGFLIYKKKIRLGRFIIAIGTGAGLISLLLNFSIIVITRGIPINWFLSFSTLGIIFSVLARRIVKPKTKVRHYLKRRLKI